MTEGAACAQLLAEYVLPPDDDVIFGFKTEQWFDPPFELLPIESEQHKNLRLNDEADFRQKHNPTHWHRYATLARHTVEPLWFDEIWNDFETDPSTLNHLVWYNFMYHVDQRVNIHPKLEAWANLISQPYLSIHAPNALELDTSITTWKKYKPSTTPWVKVGINKRPSKPKFPAAKNTSKPASLTPLPNPYARHHRPNRSYATDISPIPEEETDAYVLPSGRQFDSRSASEEHTILKSSNCMSTVKDPISKASISQTSGVNPSTFSANTEDPYPPQAALPGSEKVSDNHQPQKEHENTSKVSADDGKMSALIPNLNVPVNDGTIRITLRWKTTVEVSRLSKSSSQMNASIHNLLYKWNDEG